MEEVWVGGVRKWGLVRGVERVQVERWCKYRVKRCEQGNGGMMIGGRWVEGWNDGGEEPWVEEGEKEGSVGTGEYR